MIVLKNVVLKQQKEKDRLLALDYVERTKTAEARKWLDSELIKVVLGPRRAGKSVFSLSLLRGRPFAYFNFDDEGLPGWDDHFYDELIKELHVVYGETKNLLLDEIQNLPKWELFVNRLHRTGYNLVLTGSNAHLLGREMATALTGRHIPIEILPFDFPEFLRAKKFDLVADCPALPEEMAKFLRLVEEYLLGGGYPELVVKGLDSRGYLSVLFDSLLFKDVVVRHKVRFSGQIDGLGSYLMSNLAAPYTLRKLANILGFKSDVTLEKYLGYLTGAYLFFSLRRYSPKAGERARSPQKIYAVDNGFASAKAIQHSPDTGRLMENLVFTELVKRGLVPNRDLFYYKTRHDREVDFVVKQGAAVAELIQVAYTIGVEGTRQRELKALAEAAGELRARRATIITWDEKEEIHGGETDVDVVPLWEWLAGARE